MPTVQIEGLPDMEFPDDTPQEVIDRVVKREVAAIKRPEQDTLTDGEESFQRGLRALQQVPHVKEAIRRDTGKAIGTVARIGVPVAATIAFPPSVGATIPQLLAYMGGMAAAGGAGEALGQAVAGEQASVPAVAGAALRSSVPATTPLSAGVSQAAANIAARAIEEGGLPGLKAYGTETALPMAIGLGGSVAGKIAAGLRGGAAAARDIERAGITPSIGQAFPSVARPAAAQETKLANLAKGQRAAAQLAEAEATAAGRFGPAPVPEEAAQRTAEAMGLPEARAIAAELRGEKPAGLVESLRARAQRVRGEQAVEAGIEAQAAKAEAQTLPTGAKAFQRVDLSKEVTGTAETLHDLFEGAAKDKYGAAGDAVKQRVFNLDEAREGQKSVSELVAELTASVPKELVPGVKQVTELLTRTKTVKNPNARAFDPTAPLTVSVMEPASVEELRRARRAIYDFADARGAAFDTVPAANAKRLGAAITDLIDAQSGKLGDAGPLILEANRFYRGTRGIFDDYGVRQLFASSKQQQGTAAQQIAADVAKYGTQAQRYQNLDKIRANLVAEGVQGVPTMEDINNAVISGLVDPAVDKITGAFTTKGLRGLADRLGELNKQDPAALAKLGFGSTADLNTFARLVEEAGNVAGKPDAIARLLTSTVGQTIAGPYLARLKNASGIGAIMDEMRANAVRDPNARQAVMDLSGWVSNDILQRAKAANWDLEKVLGNKDQQAALREIMGAPAFQTFKDIFGPAFKRMNVAAVAAGAAGTASQTAVEDILAQGARAATQAASGNLSNAGQNALGALLNTGKYEIIARLIGQSAGSSGLLSKAQVAQRFNRALEAVGRQGVLQSETLKGIGNAISGEPSEK